MNLPASADLANAFLLGSWWFHKRPRPVFFLSRSLLSFSTTGETFQRLFWHEFNQIQQQQLEDSIFFLFTLVRTSNCSAAINNRFSVYAKVTRICQTVCSRWFFGRCLNGDCWNCLNPRQTTRLNSPDNWTPRFISFGNWLGCSHGELSTRYTTGCVEHVRFGSCALIPLTHPPTACL